jgi:hypothetical protein
MRLRNIAGKAGDPHTRVIVHVTRADKLLDSLVDGHDARFACRDGNGN